MGQKYFLKCVFDENTHAWLKNSTAKGGIEMLTEWKTNHHSKNECVSEFDRIFTLRPRDLQNINKH